MYSLIVRSNKYDDRVRINDQDHGATPVSLMLDRHLRYSDHFRWHDPEAHAVAQGQPSGQLPVLSHPGRRSLYAGLCAFLDVPGYATLSLIYR